jgi:peroxiredoxin
MGAAKQEEMLRTGQRAPDFKLAQMDGRAVTLSELLAGGPVLLAFFKTTCPVCQLTFPFLERIYQGRASGAFAVHGISQDDSETTRDFNAEFGITFPMLLDTAETGYPASNAYGISHVPSMFLVDHDRTIVWSLEGFNKRELQALAGKAGVSLYRPGEKVPDWKAG